MRLEGFEDISTVLRAGVYALAYRGAVVYVGKSKSLYSRIYAHRSMWTKARQGKKPPAWWPSSVKGILFDEVHIRPCRLDQLDALEQELINRYKPRYNVQLKAPGPITAPIPLTINGVALCLNQPSQPQPKPAFERRI